MYHKFNHIKAESRKCQKILRWLSWWMADSWRKGEGISLFSDLLSLYEQEILTKFALIICSKPSVWGRSSANKTDIRMENLIIIFLLHTSGLLRRQTKCKCNTHCKETHKFQISCGRIIFPSLLLPTLCLMENKNGVKSERNSEGLCTHYCKWMHFGMPTFWFNSIQLKVSTINAFQSILRAVFHVLPGNCCQGSQQQNCCTQSNPAGIFSPVVPGIACSFTMMFWRTC